MISAAKAWAGAATAALAVATDAAVAHNGHFTLVDYLTIAGAAVAGFTGVYYSPRFKKGK